MAWNSASADAANPAKFWGYIHNPDGSVAPYPKIRILNSDGSAYGSVYIGDGGGVFSLFIPNTEMTVEVYTPGNKTWIGKAYLLVGAHTTMTAGAGSVTPNTGGSSAGGGNNTWLYILGGAGLLGVAVWKRWIKIPKF